MELLLWLLAVLMFCAILLWIREHFFVRKVTLLVTYHSGAQVRVRCKEYEIKRDGSGMLTSLYVEQAKPWPSAMAVDRMESVWRVR